MLIEAEPLVSVRSIGTARITKANTWQTPRETTFSLSARVCTGLCKTKSTGLSPCGQDRARNISSFEKEKKRVKESRERCVASALAVNSRRSIYFCMFRWQ